MYLFLHFGSNVDRTGARERDQEVVDIAPLLGPHVAYKIYVHLLVAKGGLKCIRIFLNR